MKTNSLNKMKTVSAIMRGGFCGSNWMPGCDCRLEVSDDLQSRFGRITGGRVTFRDALMSLLNEKGGDFQNASFTADSTITIKRSNGKFSHVRHIEIATLTDCGDLVNPDSFTYDYSDED